MRSRLRDPRLHRWPRITKGRNGLSLSCKVLTPVRLKALEGCLYSPAVSLWKVMAVLLVVDGLLLHFRGVGILGSFTLERTALYGFMVSLLILWHLEIFLDRSLSRIIFGKRLRIRVSEDSVRIGGFWRRHIFARNKPLMFGLHDYDKPEDPVYMRSKMLCVVVADSRRVRLLGIYGRNAAEDVIENVNMMLQLHCESRDGDVDIDLSRLPRMIH